MLKGKPSSLQYFSTCQKRSINHGFLPPRTLLSVVELYLSGEKKTAEQKDSNREHSFFNSYLFFFFLVRGEYTSLSAVNWRAESCVMRTDRWVLGYSGYVWVYLSLATWYRRSITGLIHTHRPRARLWSIDSLSQIFIFCSSTELSSPVHWKALGVRLSRVTWIQCSPVARATTAKNLHFVCTTKNPTPEEAKLHCSMKTHFIMCQSSFLKWNIAEHEVNIALQHCFPCLINLQGWIYKTILCREESCCRRLSQPDANRKYELTQNNKWLKERQHKGGNRRRILIVILRR